MTARTIIPVILLAFTCCGILRADNTDPAPQTILFLGDSLTAGLGVMPEEAFPSLIQDKIDSADLPYRVINAGVSGDTSAGGLRRIDWLLQRPISILVLELGANDGLRGQTVESTRQSLSRIIDKVRARSPDATILLAGMQLPPNMGQDYIEAFSNIFPELAEEKQTALIPFLLQGVGGHPEFNQPDGIHPNAKGHAIVAENVWQVLEAFLQTEGDSSK